MRKTTITESGVNLVHYVGAHPGSGTPASDQTGDKIAPAGPLLAKSPQERAEPAALPASERTGGTRKLARRRIVGDRSTLFEPNRVANFTPTED